MEQKSKPHGPMHSFEINHIFSPSCLQMHGLNYYMNLPMPCFLETLRNTSFFILLDCLLPFAQELIESIKVKLLKPRGFCPNDLRTRFISCVKHLNIVNIGLDGPDHLSVNNSMFKSSIYFTLAFTCT